MRKKETRISRLFLRGLLRTILFILLPVANTMRFGKRDVPDEPHVYAVWHEELFAATEYLRHTHTLFMISGNHIGQSGAVILERLGYDVVFGSARHGGSRALRNLADAVREKPRNVLMAVDGSRGPRRVMKAGACVLAYRTGLPVRLLRCRARGLRLPTWDRMVWPLPFARIHVTSDTVHMPAEATREEINELVAACAARLDEL
jgi:lysophospholipid acyltransferase (LPLAT)-like uncharacterized protein